MKGLSLFLSFILAIQLEFAKSIDLCTAQVNRKSAISSIIRPIIMQGTTMPEWKADFAKPYVSPPDESIEYFYFIALTSNGTSTDIKFTPEVKSNDTNSATPELKVALDSLSPFTSDKLFSRTLEVIYNCKDTHAVVQITVTITTSLCNNPMDFHYVKQCVPSNHAPPVNIGLTPNMNNIMNEGVFSTALKLGERENDFILDPTHDTITFYVSAGKSEDLTLSNTKVIYDESNLNILEGGELSKGGKLKQDNAEKFILNFYCVPFKKSKTEIQVSFVFENYHVINLFFSKECDNLEQINEYFSILYTIYWILLFLIVFFIIAIVMYYMKRTNSTLTEVLLRAFDYLKNMFSRGESHESLDYNMDSRTSRNNKRITEGLYDEKEIVDLDIKDSSANRNQGLTTKQLKPDSSYGGI